MTEKRLARHNAVAVFADLDRALEAVAAVRDAGVPDTELSLVGPEHVMLPGQHRPVESAAHGSGPAKGAVAGIATGGLTGGVLGAIAGLAVTAIPGVGLAAGAAALYAGIAGAAAGHITGGLLGAETGARKQMMLDQTLNPLLARVDSDGVVLVGVHSDDEERLDSAHDALAGLDPAELHRLEADEEFIPPGDRTALAGRSIPSGDPTQPGGELGRDVADEDADQPKVGMAERGDEDAPTRGA